jgi:hypothetical protein
MAGQEVYYVSVRSMLSLAFLRLPMLPNGTRSPCDQVQCIARKIPSQAEDFLITSSSLLLKA